jgi:hypothetical protein
MSRTILLLHPSRLRGENHGVYIQHVATMQWLLDGCEDMRVEALDPLHPRFADAAVDADLAIVHMLPHREVDALIRIRSSRNLPTIFEFGDNFLDLGDWVPKRNLLRSPLVRQNLLYYAARCDAVQVYAPALAELFRNVNPNVIVLDPYVPVVEAAQPRGEHRFVFGWGGTTSHERDLERIAPAVVAFCRAHADATFAWMGEPAMFARHFSGIPAGQTRIAPFGDYEQYLAFVRGLDAGLAPSADSGFNAGRTDTKFLTYAASGVAPILEDAPHHRAHADRAYLFRGAAGLRDALEALYADRELLRAVAARAHAWASAERSARHLRLQRIEAYQPFLRESRADAAVVADDVQVPPDVVERLIDLGSNEPADVLTTVREIAEEFPGYVQAQWALASALERTDPNAALVQLDAVEWPVLYADLAAEMRARIGRRLSPATAAQQLERVQSPLARLRLTMSPQRDGVAFHRAVLDEQPWDYFSLAATLRHLQQSEPDSLELDELYARACLVAPEIVPPDRRPESLVRFLPR